MSILILLTVLISIAAFLLILTVMVQEGKGGGLSSSAFGGSQIIGGVKETADFITKFTWTIAVIFASLILISNVTLKDDTKKVEEEVIQEGE